MLRAYEVVVAMSRESRLTLLGLTMIAGLAVSACASRTGSTGSEPTTAGLTPPVGSAITISGLPALTYTGTIVASQELKYDGILLQSPSVLNSATSSTPLMSAVSAYRSCLTSAAVCGRSAGGTISLGVVTISGSGTSNSDGSMTPLEVRRLNYIATWPNESCAPVGPTISPGSTIEPAPSPQKCTLTAYIDANTGSPVYSTEGPP
jgi:hypothetical protein